MDLEGKTALVLGAVKGIGREIGLALAARGVCLGLTWHDWEDHLPDMQAAFAASGTDPLILRIDLNDTDRIPGLIEQVVSRFGRLDILINNIERGGWPVVHGPYKKAQWDMEMATTLRAKQWVFQAALPYLKKSGQGVVINFSSIAGVVGRSGPAAPVFNDGYATASRGVSLLTETWARMGAPEVRVNEIMLGFIDTRHAQNTRGWSLLSDPQKQAIIDHTLMKRTGRPDDIVKAVMYIIQNAPFMTGSVIRLDGGYVLGGEAMSPIPEGVE